jgi:hypothetical protein
MTQPVVPDPPTPTGTNMNLSTSGLCPEFEPCTYLLNVTGVCVQEGKKKVENDTVSITYTNLQLKLWRGWCGWTAEFVLVLEVVDGLPLC